jgi:predicted transcriptional regulator
MRDIGKQINTRNVTHLLSNKKDIASKLSIASPTVNWYMKRFTTDGIVKTQRTGRLTNYFITPEALCVLTNIPNIRQKLQAEVYGQ